MANATSVQLLEDGPRFAVIKFGFFLDTSDLVKTTIFDPSVQYADPTGSKTTKISIQSAMWSVPSGLTLRLQWDATTPAEAIACAFSDHQNYVVPIQNNAGAGVTQKLVAISNGWVGVMVGQVVLQLLKEGP